MLPPQGGNVGAKEATGNQLMVSASSQPAQRKMGEETHEVISTPSWANLWLYLLDDGKEWAL